MTTDVNLARAKSFAEALEALKTRIDVQEVRERRAREDYATGRIDEVTLERRLEYKGTFR